MLIQDKHKPQRQRALWRLTALVALLLAILLAIALRPEPSPYEALPDGQVYCGAEKVRDGQFREQGLSFSGDHTQSEACARYGRYGSYLPASDSISEGMGYVLEHPLPGQAFQVSVWCRTKSEDAAVLAAKVTGDSSYQWVSSEWIDTDSLGWSQLELYCFVPYGKNSHSIRFYTYSTGTAEVCFDDLLIRPLPDPTDFQLPRLRILGKQAFFQAQASARLETDSSASFPITISQSADTYTLQLPADQSWQGMRHFTLRPIEEEVQGTQWLHHQLAVKAGLLTPYCGITEVYHNQQSLGLFAYEEAIDSGFLYRNPYPEGPIVYVDDFGESPSPVLQAVHPPPDSLPELREQFAQAQRLFQQYHEGQRPLAQTVAVEQLADQLAIASLLGITPYPPKYWYCNTTTDKLHPISQMSNTLHSKTLPQLLRDESFANAYLSTLYRMSEPDSVAALLDPLTADWAARKIHLERALTEALPSMSDLRQRIAQQRNKLIPHSPHTLTAYTESVRGPTCQLSVLNQHHLPLRVVGYGRGGKKMQAGLEKTLMLWPAAWYNPESDSLFTSVEVSVAATHLFYRLPGIDSVFASPILNTPAPAGPTDWQQLLSKAGPKPDATYTIDNKTVLFPAGEHQLEETLVVPADHTLILESGAIITLSQLASLISLGPVRAIGQEAKPVKISSSPNGGGLAILQAPEPSSLQYVLMENLRPPAYLDWRLSAGFTLYESDAELSNCAWLKSGVQSIRSKVEARTCLISEAEADGWQVDYGEARLQDCRFEQCQNNGLAAKGSRLLITQCRFTENTNHGLYATANSRVNGEQGRIAKSTTAIGASDHTEVHWKGLSVEDCALGFAAFEEKPEFGPAQIILADLKTESVGQLQNVSSQSHIRTE
jgi:hypothetical protein